MSFDVETHARFAPSMALRAIEFLNDPHAYAREYLGDDSPSNERYPYSLGVAMGMINGLLDAAGFPELGPDRFDCEWSVTHPYQDDEYES